jgi:hypothetical protein
MGFHELSKKTCMSHRKQPIELIRISEPSKQRGLGAFDIAVHRSFLTEDRKTIDHTYCVKFLRMLPAQERHNTEIHTTDLLYSPRHNERYRSAQLHEADYIMTSQARHWTNKAAKRVLVELQQSQTSVNCTRRFKISNSNLHIYKTSYERLRHSARTRKTE